MRIPIALMAIAASLSVTLPAQQVDGFYLSPRHTALVWSQSDTNLQMWRVQLGAKPQWTELAEPQQVLAFMHRQKKEDPESSGVAVDVASGILRLFWLQHTDCEAKQAESRPYPDDTLPCAYTLHQAATPVANLIAGKDSGAVWRVTSSKMIDTPSEEMVDFDEIKMVDRQHGWMILSDNSLMNRMPQNLATTADGGAHWTTQKAKGMPIGTDFSQLLIARSATEAWFAELREGDEPLGMWHTVDGGKLWKIDHALSHKFPWCEDCDQGPTWQLPSRNGIPCFALGLQSEPEPSVEQNESPGRYCMAKDGKTWLPATKMSNPGDSIESYFSSPLFADQRLGFQAVTAKSEFITTIYETTDGGMNWYASSLATGEDIRLEQSLAQGQDVLLLLSGEDSHRKLMYSPDRGTTWTEMELPH